jgi:hypothetical protein
MRAPPASAALQRSSMKKKWLLISTQPKTEMVRRMDHESNPAAQLDAHGAIGQRLSEVVRA